MLEFYKKAATLFLCLVVLTSLLAIVCIKRVFVSDELLPASESVLPWTIKTNTDVQIGGSSTTTIVDSTSSLEYSYKLTSDTTFPYVTHLLAFAELENANALVDISSYSGLTFKIRCSTHSVVTFYVYTLDDKVTDPKIFTSYRIASTFFTCNETWSEIEIDLQHLKIPIWWMESVKLDIGDQAYRLDKVLAIAFDNNNQGPVNSLVKVKINEISLHKYDWRFIWILIGLSLVLWAGFIVWLIKHYAFCLIADVKQKMIKNRPLIAYQQLSLEPHKDKEKSQLLRFMATEYTNPDLSLENAIDTLGINRTKINDLLKEELGLTFSTYLNKLRLTEAARLLSQKEDASIADIAYSVGYNNVSYFNKLFKTEYGCTPKRFKGLYDSSKSE